MPNGEVEASTADPIADQQWEEDRKKIIEVARKFVGADTIKAFVESGGDADNHGDHKFEKHRARKYEAKLSFKNFLLSEGKSGPFGVKIGGISTEKPEVGFEDRLNYEKAKSECKDAGIPFKSTSKFGVHYITFNNEADQKKAVKLIKKVIDKSVESEW